MKIQDINTGIIIKNLNEDFLKELKDTKESVFNTHSIINKNDDIIIDSEKNFDVLYLENKKLRDKLCENINLFKKIFICSEVLSTFPDLRKLINRLNIMEVDAFCYEFSSIQIDCICKNILYLNTNEFIKIYELFEFAKDELDEVISIISKSVDDYKLIIGKKFIFRRNKLNLEYSTALDMLIDYQNKSEILTMICDDISYVGNQLLDIVSELSISNENFNITFARRD